VSSLFCRHNRFTADCPICSKGTVLDSSRQTSKSRGGSRRGSGGGAGQGRGARVVTGPYVSAGPYADPGGGSYEVRLERVPGGVRLAAWTGGSLERRAPVIRAVDLPALVGNARERSVLPPRDLDPLDRALATEPHDGGGEHYGASAGRAGDLREELRVEPLDEGALRIARWIYRPNQGWELQEAPVMLPAKRVAQALADAAKKGILRRAAASA
jgi:hypothetical protein